MRYGLHILLIILVLGVTAATARTIDVPRDYISIQQAIDAAQDGDTVLTAPGRYTGALNFNGRNIVLASHYVLNGDESHINNTVIDADGSPVAITYENGESRQATLIGFTITGAGSNANITEELDYGAAIFCRDASPAIARNIIAGNRSEYYDYGGAIICRDSEAFIKHNIIRENVAGQAYSTAGGIIVLGGDVVICDNIIENQTFYFVRYAGGILLEHAQSSMIGNIIRYNGGGYVFNGGGILSRDSSITHIERCLIDSNYYDGRQAGILSLHSFGNSNNVTIVNHLVGVGVFEEASLHLRNAIVWDCREGGIATDDTTYLAVNYSNITGGAEEHGSANMEQDPLFNAPEKGDYRLRAYSPCIDAGDPYWEHDPDGTRTDMGWMPFTQSLTDVPLGFSSEENFINVRLSGPNPFTGATHLKLHLVETADVSVNIFDISGHRIRHLNFGPTPAGDYDLEWNGADDHGLVVPEGFYLYRIRALNSSGTIHTKTLKLIKQDL